MNKKLLHTVIAGALFMQAGVAVSAEYIDGCSFDVADKNTHVYYVNGAGASYSNVEASTAALMGSMDHTNYLFRMSYNVAPGSFDSIYSALDLAINQHALQGGIITPDLLASWFANGITLDAAHDFLRVSIHVDDPEPLIEALNADVWASLNESYATAFVNAMDMADAPSLSQLNYYEADLLAGKRVILVAHSQASVVVAATLAALEERQPGLMGSVGVVYVAPTTEIPGSSLYVSADDDRVLNTLRESGNAVPDATLTQSGAGAEARDFMRHDFLAGYFNNDLASYADIQKHLSTLDQTLILPPVQAGSGAIRASLTWDSFGDMDIFIEEPNGEILYYANTEGELLSGQIDVDNRRGFGPENYYVGCNKLMEGTYRIGGNFYSASTPYLSNVPVDATLSVFLGSGQIPKPVELTFEQARSSNDTYQMMVEINVTIDADGNLYYDTIPLVGQQ